MSEVKGPICHTTGIRGHGNPDEGVVIVGIAPGRDEQERTGRPFTGESGKLLDKLLKFTGWHRDRVYTTNTICYWNNAPTQEQLDGCNDRFRMELFDIKPKLIITAGAVPNEVVMGRKRPKGSRGSVNWSDYWKAYVLDTHHPAAVLHSQSMSFAQDILRDFRKIPRILDMEPGAKEAEVIYSVVESLAEAQEVLDNLPTDGFVTLDIETSNPDIEVIDAYTDQLLTLAVSYTDQMTGRDRTVVFPTRIFPQCVRDGTHAYAARTGGTCPDLKCPLGAAPSLIWPTHTVNWLFQNGPYDIVGIHEYFGYLLFMAGDTLLMSQCGDERPGYHGLKPNAREYLAAGWYEEEVKKFYKKGMHLLPPEKVEQYNAKDANYTLKLEPLHRARMEADGTDTLYNNILLPAMQTFVPMQIRGINIDQKRLQELAYHNWFPKYITMHRELQIEAQEIGWPTDDLNFNSTPQLRELFYNIIGVEVTKLTKGKKPSLDKETLDRMDHPFAAKLRGYRTLDTTIDYVMSIMKNLKRDGRIHPTAFVSQARTGRTAYHDPAVQTFPKDYTVGADYARIREVIIPHNPDTHEIIEADYNQIEVWLAWAWSGDEILHQHLLSGDVHSATAELAFKTKRELWSKADWDIKRQNAKKIRFGIQYGEGAEKLSSPPPVGIGGTAAEARIFIQNYKASYPVYSSWMLDIQRQALQQGYLLTPSGRVMRFPYVLDHKELRQALNFPIQGTASDYNLISMIELAHPDHKRYQLAAELARYNSWIILNIHDALVVESDRRYRNEVMALVRHAMEKEKFAGFPSIHVDMKVGDSLGTVQKV